MLAKTNAAKLKEKTRARSLTHTHNEKRKIRKSKWQKCCYVLWWCRISRDNLFRWCVCVCAVWLLHFFCSFARNFLHFISASLELLWHFARTHHLYFRSHAMPKEIYTQTHTMFLKVVFHRIEKRRRDSQHNWNGTLLSALTNVP